MLIRALGTNLLDTEGCFLFTLQDMGDRPPVSGKGPGDRGQAGGRPGTPPAHPTHPRIPTPLETTSQHPPTRPGRPTQAGLSWPKGASSRTRYHIHDSCMRFDPLPPDPVTGRPRMEASIIAVLDAKKVPVYDFVISFLLKVGGQEQ